MEIIRRLINKVKNLFIQAVVKEINTSGYYQIVTFDQYDQDKEATLNTPYGLYCYPDDGALLQVFQVQGNESNKVCFASDPSNTPDMEKGEVILMNIKTGKKIKFNKDGDISIEDKIIVKSNGDVEITGSSSVTIQGTDWKTHQHKTDGLPDGYSVAVPAGGGSTVAVVGVSGGVV